MSAARDGVQDLQDLPPVCDLVQDLEGLQVAADAWRRESLEVDGPNPASRWPAVRCGPGGRARAWACPLLLGARLEVHHCGHPTALRPYYVPGLLRELGTFRRLNQAQACAEAVLLPRLLHVKHTPC